MTENKCTCGFKFSGPGEFRNCECFLDKETGQWVSICPDCGKGWTKE